MGASRVTFWGALAMAVFSDFPESLFGPHARKAAAHETMHAAGVDRHAKIVIDIEDAYQRNKVSTARRWR